ncbi:MAG TPA: hypothetical protein VK660_10015 [Xanthomonadaceae bacterium]|jgi:hypothetical protein|nr:hypothetical protein [Xanthomonadaceae bacterium]
MVTVIWSKLLDAFEFTSFSVTVDCTAYVDLETGSLYCVSDHMDLELEEDRPDDLETSDRYLALPHKNDLDLGKDLAFAFVHQHLPGEFDKVAGFFRARGAYGRFKDLLDRRGALHAWYAFEEQATESALREWCGRHDIRLVSEPAA